jgi:hypothetical protein
MTVRVILLEPLRQLRQRLGNTAPWHRQRLVGLEWTTPILPPVDSVDPTAEMLEICVPIHNPLLIVG